MACAVKTDPISQLEKDLECSVCLEVLKDPRTLPCCHSFCKDCLEGVVQTCRATAPHGRPIQEIPCPNCRAMFPLDPDKHVADMPRNHFICNLVKVTAVLDRGIGVPCSHNCNQSYSVARCVTCEKFLCRECLTIHNSYRGHDGHSVLTMEELSKPENRKKIKDKMYCNEHSGKKLKVYCETCDQLICRDCMDFKHVKQGHSCFLVKDVANSYKKLLALNNKEMEDALTESNDFILRLSFTTEQLDRGAENIKSQIVKKTDAVLKTVAGMLKQRTQELLNKVDEIHDEKRANLDRQTEETNQFVENIKTSVELSKKLVDQGTEEEIVSSQKMMLDNANNLLAKREEYLKAPIPVVKLGYTFHDEKGPINQEILRGLRNTLGEVNGGNEEERKVVASGLPEGATESNVFIHFQKRRNGGGEIEKVTLLPGNEALILFQDPEVASRIVTRPQEMKGKVLTVKSKVADPTTSGSFERTARESSSNPEGTTENNKLSCTVHQNIEVYVYQGDITKEIVDAIVNPANEDLNHADGTAGAIVRAGGKSIQDESNKIMKKRQYKRLASGEVALTGAGNLPCKWVIHAVGPRWSDYLFKESAKRDLYNAVYNSLTVANHYATRSISIPAISSGIFGVPVGICAEVLFSAVIYFSQNASKGSSPTSLKEIRFVNIDEATTQVFAREMKRLYGTSVQQESVESKKATFAGCYDPGRNNGDKTKNADPMIGASGGDETETCSICLCDFTDREALSKCGHSFCSGCIDRAFKYQKKCPVCSQVYGPLMGNQPPGKMTDTAMSTRLPGFPSCGSIVIVYKFDSGVQGENHPNPGQRYTGTTRRAYLPDNTEGRKVLKLLRKAFDQKLTFTIGRSSTTGSNNVITWNDIHHKTNTHGGPTSFGYPDPDYLRRVQDELAAKGITDKKK